MVFLGFFVVTYKQEKGRKVINRVYRARKSAYIATVVAIFITFGFGIPSANANESVLGGVDAFPPPRPHLSDHLVKDQIIQEKQKYQDILNQDKNV